MKLPFSKELERFEVKGRIIVVAFAILFGALIYYFDGVWSFICKLFSLASPFFIGFAIAFLLGPMQRRIENVLDKSAFFREKHVHGKRLISTAVSVLVLLTIVFVLLRLLLPQLIQSIGSIVAYISAFLKNNSNELNKLLLKFDILSVNGDELVLAWENIVSSQIKNITMLLNNIVNISSNVVNSLYQLLVGLITAFYILMDKARLCARMKKIGYSIMEREKIETLIYWTRKANHIFAGFINGKIVDSAIIGAICYVGMLIFKMEFPLLISVIIGVTNIIPFFGPFIGWAPCALILLMVNPMSALWFSVFVLVLQQLDGNLIGPHILGDYVGMSALQIMIAIVIGGGLFGFVGMLISVPLFALGYAICRTFVYARLQRKHLPTDTAEYERAPEDLHEKTPATGDTSDNTPDNGAEKKEEETPCEPQP